MTRIFDLPTTFPITCHTDYVGAGSTFVAIKGFSFDGADYIQSALDKGAATIVVAHDAQLSNSLVERIARANARLERVADTRFALAQLSAQAAGNPAAQVSLLGITGTKGKTTTAWLTYDILISAGYSVALMSGVLNKINGVEFAAPLTTAQPDYIHQFLKMCVEQKVTHVVMEVAAQAVSLHRIAGLQFDIVAFTNFGYEHLEFYPTMDDYFAAKVALISYCKPSGTVCLNVDDTWVEKCRALHSRTVTYSCTKDADVRLELRDEADGLHFDLRYHKRKMVFQCPQLMGDYNLYNCAAALAIVLQLPIESIEIAAGLEQFAGVPGRLEAYKLESGATAIIDYAHTPDSYRAVLSTLRERTNNLIVIFGAGGKRDKSKRPIMGGIAASYADQIILTSDNPRNEDPSLIVQDIMQGIDDKDHNKVIIQLDRARAIEAACSKAPKKAIIAILGKGNDEYQIVGDTKHYFSERDIIQQFV